MIDVSEHFYDDDPGRGHADVRTRLDGASYFFLGNGLIQAAVQWAPRGEGTPLGLLVMDPDRLRKKREALSFDPDNGLETTAICVKVDGGEENGPSIDDLTVAWTSHRGVPAVRADWSAGDVLIDELFYCCDRSSPRLARAVRLRTSSDRPCEVVLSTGVRRCAVQQTVVLPAGGEVWSWFVYSLDAAAEQVRPSALPDDPMLEDAITYWSDARMSISFGDDMLDRFFDAARTQLPAVVSRRGRVDASIWQYNREWVRDQALMALGLVMLGHRSEAGTIFRRLLREFITTEGAPLDSSEVRDPDEVELDQNGFLLYALQQYVLWTGDFDLITASWGRITAIAGYPLRAEFRHQASGLLYNRREFWERHRIHGIEPGFEMVHQVFVSIGLAAAASLARMTGHQEEAIGWDREASALGTAALTDARFGMVHEGQIIKRRRLDGSVQACVDPLPEAQLPPSVPLAARGLHWLNPDTCTALPIAFGFVDPASPLAAATLRGLELLWNQGWRDGGYGRYHVSSEPDSPGGWPFASIFVARAAIDAGQPDRAWRVLRWLDTVPGAAAGSWFEYYGFRAAPPFPQVGVIPWTWSEMLALFVHHVLGIRLGERHVRIAPRLLPGLPHVSASIPIQDGRLEISIQCTSDVVAPIARTRYGDGSVIETTGGDVAVPYGAKTVRIDFVFPETEAYGG
jgi:hypothetical protein